jgi:hypothetical protein
VSIGSRPELPFIAAGTIAIIGGTIRDKGVPKDAPRAVIGTVVLVLVASTTDGTKLAPLVHALGLLLVLGTTIAAVNAYNKRKK